MDLFIKYVREIPCLWNPLHKSYRDMGVKDEAWRVIVKKLKSPYIPDGKYSLHYCWSHFKTELKAVLLDETKYGFVDPYNSLYKSAYFICGTDDKLLSEIRPLGYMSIDAGRGSGAELRTVLVRKSLSTEADWRFYAIPLVNISTASLLSSPLQWTVSIVPTAKAEWKKLRDNHRDSLKRNKAGSSGLNVERINTWKYAEQMEFLVPHMKLRKRPFVILAPNQESDTEDNSESSAAVSHNIMNLEESHDSEHSRSIEGDAVDDTTKIRRKEDLISFELLRNNYNYEQPSEVEAVKRESVKNRHPLDSFFESMCETTKQFPLWLQKKVKRQVFTVISEAEDCLDSTYERSVPSSSNYAYVGTSTGSTTQRENVILKAENDPL